MMKVFNAAAIVVCVMLALIATPAMSQTTTPASEEPLRLIDEQQQRLEAQEAQLAEQQQELELLRHDIEALQDQHGTPTEDERAGKTAAPSPTADKSFQAAGAAKSEEWPGFYRVPGTSTRFKLSGFVELDLIRDSDAILTPAAFVTQAIVTRDATSAQGADGRTSFSIQASRIALETRTPLDEERRVTSFIAVDFFNDFGGTTPEPRLRQAYGEVNNFLHWGGDLLLGQDWSTFTNLYAVPGPLEFQGPNAIFGTRHPMLRWTKPLGAGFKMKLAAEAPDLRVFERSDAEVGVNAESAWPDGVVALNWEQASANIMAAYLARDLRAKAGDGSSASVFGWGASLQGRLALPGVLKEDAFQFSLTYGEGIGGVLNDVPPDAIYDVERTELKPIPTLAWFVAYQHWWISQRLYSLATYASVEQDTLEIQAPTAYKHTQYAAVDLVWTPHQRWLLGVEVMYGSREDHDGESGEVIRSLLTSRLNFP